MSWSCSARQRKRIDGGIRLELERRFEVGTVLNIQLDAADGSPAFVTRVIHSRTEASGKCVIGSCFATILTEEELEVFLGERAGAGPPSEALADK